MRHLSSLLLGCIVSLQASAKIIPVSSPEALGQAIARSQAGDHIVLADGRYADRVYHLRSSGTKASPITIEAKNPGKVMITGKSGFYIYGSHWMIKGLFFRDGQHTDELYTVTHPSQYNIFVLYGDHIRITECAIHNFFPKDVLKARYISSEFGPNGFPQFIRIDHCSFISDERIGDGQFIGINNSFPNHPLFRHNSKRAPFFESDNDYADILKNYPDAIGEAGQPLFCRIDHCYFGIYGGSISRWGHFGDEFDLRRESFLGKFGESDKTRAIYDLIPEQYRKKYRAWGGIVFDGNLVEGQRCGDAELICSKVGQNVYYNNTFYNVKGFLSLRGGTQEVIIDNYFLSDAPFKAAETGQIVGWGQEHTIVGNYFRVNNNSGLAMTSGRDGTDTGHDTVAHSTVAYNTFEVWNPKAFALDFRSKYDRRQKLKTGSVEYAYTTIYDNLFKGNTFIHTSQNAKQASSLQWRYTYNEILQENHWQGNYYAGAPLGVYYHTNPKWHFMTVEQLKTIEESEVTDEIVDAFTGVQPIAFSSLLRDGSGLYQNPQVKREKLKIRDIATFPYVLSDLCDGKLTPVQLKGKLLPGAHDLDLTDFGNYTNPRRPLGHKDVGPAWLIHTLSKIGPKIRHNDVK